MIDAAPAPYPVRLTMQYPERLSRLSTAFRIILLIPVAIFLALVSGELSGWGDSGEGRSGGIAAGAAGGGVVLAIWATILVKQRIPRWLFDFQAGVNRFTARAYAYFALLTDQYPAFEGDWVVQYDIDYPERVSRWKVLFWKLFASIPHFIILIFLGIAAAVVVVISWFIILFTSAFPRGMHDFVVGVMRWGARVTAYFQSLTDAFPPYSLDADAPAGSQASERVSVAIGATIVAIAVAAAISVAVFLVMLLNKEKTEDADYAALLNGEQSAVIELDKVEFEILDAEDPAVLDYLVPHEGQRLVTFVLRYQGKSAFQPESDTRKIDDDSVRLETNEDGSIDPLLLTFSRVPAPLRVPKNAAGELVAIFEIDDDAVPRELRAYPNASTDRHVAWKLE